MGSEFQQYIEGEKQARLSNLDTLRENQPFDLGSLSKTGVEGFFQDREVTNDTIKAFLLSTDEAYSQLLEGYFTNIDSGGEDYKEIMREISEKGPFHNPRELVEAISDYMREHMTYDTFTALEQLQTSDGAIGEFSLILNHPEASLTHYHLQVLEEVFGIYRGENIGEVPIEYTDIIVKLFEFIDNQDLDGLKQYLLGMQEEDKRLFIQLLEAFSLEQRNNQVGDSVSVTDILRTQKIGVCRHFSRIAKMIFKG